MTIIRDMIEDDTFHLEVIGDKPQLVFQQYLNEHKAGQRTVLVAESDGMVVGYAMIEWLAGHPFLAQKEIPEIAALAVAEDRRRQGIGTALMDEVEKRIAGVSRKVGICLGMSREFGPAQIMIVKRGYIPDGNGLTWKGDPINPGAQIRADGTLALVMVRDLSR